MLWSTQFGYFCDRGEVTFFWKNKQNTMLNPINALLYSVYMVIL